MDIPTQSFSRSVFIFATFCLLAGQPLQSAGPEVRYKDPIQKKSVQRPSLATYLKSVLVGAVTGAGTGAASAYVDVTVNVNDTIVNKLSNYPNLRKLLKQPLFNSKLQSAQTLLNWSFFNVIKNKLNQFSARNLDDLDATTVKTASVVSGWATWGATFYLLNKALLENAFSDVLVGSLASVKKIFEEIK